MENNFLVSVRCISYNHAPYIKDCMNGFTMQETNFPYVCVIDDDASTDGEPEVINNYLAEHFNLDDEDVVKKEETDDYHMIFAQHKTNKNCFFAVFFLNYNHYSIRKSRDKYVEKYIDGAKYIALCEGDDYWIDSMKLQKQVDFLESHPDYSMCFTDVRDYFVEEKKMGDCQSLKYKKGNLNLERCNKSEAFYYILLGICRIQTLTVMCRKKLLDEREPDCVNFLMGDTQLWLYMSQYGKIKYLCFCTGVYRIIEGSASRKKDTYSKFKFSMYEMRVFYCMKYGYKIPVALKWDYNKAMFALFSNCDILDREPLYDYFPILSRSFWEKDSCINNFFYKPICLLEFLIVSSLRKLCKGYLYF